ncbi:MAG: DegV family protein [Lachnoclostridium sp.]
MDGNRISVTQASLAQYARKLVDEGLPAGEIKEKLEETCMEAEIYITVESLEYLKRGGRIKRSSCNGRRTSECKTCP